MKIILENENYELQDYKFNFQELKTELIENLEKYQNLVVTENAIKEAKTTRADLNKLKKELSDKVIEVKKNHLKPFEAFKFQTDELIELINKPVIAIDTQIKNYEQKLKDEKLTQIKTFWGGFTKWEENVIPFDKIFQEKWLNVSESMTKIQSEILQQITKIESDVEIIKSFNSPDEIPLMTTYLKAFDMSATMRDKANFDRLRAEKLEAERQAQLRAEKLEAERQAQLRAEKLEAERQAQLRAEAEEAERQRLAAIEAEPVKELEPVTEIAPEQDNEKTQKLIETLEAQNKEWQKIIDELEIRINILKDNINGNNKRIKELNAEMELCPF